MKRFEYLHSEADRRKAERPWPGCSGVIYGVPLSRRGYVICYLMTWAVLWSVIGVLVFGQEGQVVRRELRTDKDGDVTAIFLAFSLKGLPDHPGETGYREYWILGSEFEALPQTEPARETAILAIIKLQIEKGFLSWEKELLDRPKPPKDGTRADQLQNPDGTRKAGTVVRVDLAVVRASTTTSTSTTTTRRETTTTLGGSR